MAEQLTFNDILSSNLLTTVTSFSLTDMIIAMGLAFVLGLFIFFVYKQTYSGVMYSSGFGISLIAMALITTMIIIAIGSNIILSLGMVGALSIVRFRSAVKDPMDITYLFWAISAGIVLGAGLIPLAFFGSIAIGVFLLVFSRKKSRDQPFILVVDCDGDATEKKIMDILSLSVKKLVLRSKTVRTGSVELTVEVRLAGETSEFINRIATLPGVSSAVLVTYNGEYLT
ncbi:hypothetical protein McpSp1_06920 [Methanocorpusculaceae archaeon Sp1]|uniref:DUF4956 domain-containing protein n=1 Tax=Methanorbis furvi TaxID=3028299 RepID=A0AAE4MCD6_9EURY|nr:hypothetical protein [Methanocorpusculaceae archaeon Sp1]MDV0442477.1 hypothetical protein [Methanocorpusculaceae archaeon Ag1]